MSRGVNAYVLMRVYSGKWIRRDGVVSVNEEYNKSAFESNLARAVKSVKQNRENYKKGKVILIVNDDTVCGNGFDKHEENVKKILAEDNGFSESSGDLFYINSDGAGSAYATYAIRDFFIKQAENDQDIAITLDQDDELYPNAIKHIVRGMPKGGMTVSQFSIKDTEDLDITNGGGSLHNWLTFRKRFGFNKCIKFSKREKRSFLKGKPDDRSAFWEKVRFFFAKGCWRHDFIYASTLGWTKAYTKSILARYTTDLNSFLNNNRGGDQLYFKKHRAYEDFLDFFVFLYSDVKVGWVKWNTHTYHKHADSITSRPNLDDFRIHRAASLLTLIDLAKAKSVSLRKDYEYHLLRFVTVKLIQIESILKKYRHGFVNGKNEYSVFAINTHEGYFVDNLCSLALADKRAGTDQSLSADSDLTQRNIRELFSHANGIREYNLHLKNLDLSYVMRKCIDAESRLGHVKYDVNINDEDLEKRYDKNPTPTQRRHRITKIVVYALAFLCLTLLILYFTPCITYVWRWVPVNITERIRLVDVLIPLLVAVLTFSLNELSKLKIQAIEEANHKKLYYSEFEDLIRHLEANFKVLIQIRSEMDNNKTPARIHFDNLKWPSNSCLFSDDMSKIIGRDKVDDFARLKVNLRNINNSAKWLSDVFADMPSDLEKQRECLDWELTRYFGYLLNFYYMKDNNFSFPSLWQLDEYIEGSTQRNKLSQLFLYERNADTRSDLTEKYIERYLCDRRERRSVVFFESKKDN